MAWLKNRHDREFIYFQQKNLGGVVVLGWAWDRKTIASLSVALHDWIKFYIFSITNFGWLDWKWTSQAKFVSIWEVSNKRIVTKLESRSKKKQKKHSQQQLFNLLLQVHRVSTTQPTDPIWSCIFLHYQRTETIIN